MLDLKDVKVFGGKAGSAVSASSCCGLLCAVVCEQLLECFLWRCIVLSVFIFLLNCCFALLPF